MAEDSNLGSFHSPAGGCGVVVVAGRACGAGFAAGVPACANADRGLDERNSAKVHTASRVARDADERQNIKSPPITAFSYGKRGTRGNSAARSSRITAHFERTIPVSFQLIGWTCNGMLRLDLGRQSAAPVRCTKRRYPPLKITGIRTQDTFRVP